MADAARTIMALQRRLLAAIAKTRSQAELIEMFGIPQAAVPLIDWRRLIGGTQQICRFDIVLCSDGQFRFCEINTDPALGGPEMFDLATATIEATGMAQACAPTFVSPYVDIAAFVAQEARAAGCERVVILTFTENYAEGHFDYTDFQRYLQEACGSAHVYRCSERTYDRSWLEPDEGRRTLVYRFFSHADMNDGGALFRQIMASGARILTTFEDYFYQTKQWFALLHEPELQSMMEPHEREVVRRFIPKTLKVNAGTIEALLREKSSWVFKADISESGKAVIPGDETSEADILRRIRDTSAGHWTAQELLSSPKIEVSPDGSWASRAAYVVFGLFVLGDRISGLYVRSRDVRVVSASLGGREGWCVPLDSTAL
jgi:hypothetical protein